MVQQDKYIMWQSFELLGTLLGQVDGSFAFFGLGLNKNDNNVDITK